MIWFVARAVRANTRFVSYGAVLALIRTRNSPSGPDARSLVVWSAPADSPFLVPGGDTAVRVGRCGTPFPYRQMRNRSTD